MKKVDKIRDFRKYFFQIEEIQRKFNNKFKLNANLTTNYLFFNIGTSFSTIFGVSKCL